MKKYLYILVLSLFSASTYAQLKVEASVGYSSYKMDDMQKLLSDLQKYSKEIYPFDIAITDNFPNHVNLNFGLTYELEKHEFGANLTYLTTGGKLAYSDYSGEIEMKLILNAYRLGGLYRYHFYQATINNKMNISFYGELSPGITFSKLKTKEYIGVKDGGNNIEKEDKSDYKMSGFTILPQLGANLNLPFGFGLHISGGYDFEMGSHLENSDYRANWSGLRLNAGVSYTFSLKK